MYIIHTESSCGWGGQEIRILEESRAMMSRGHQVTIVCPATSQLYLRAANWGVPVVALPIHKKRLKDFLALRHWLKHAPSPEIINTHSSTDSWLTAIALRTLGSKKKHIPIVRTRHISAPVKNSFANRWLYKQAAKFVVTTGENLRQDLINHLGLNAAQTRSIFTGIDTTRFTHNLDKTSLRQSLNLQEDVIWIGIVATLRSWKGHAYLIDAFEQLETPKARLLIVGDGPQRAALEQKVHVQGLTQRVHFAGDQQNVSPWLQAMDIFVLPSYANEGVSQAVMQAMASALPVITTAVGSMTDVIHNLKTGLLVEPRSPEQLVLALKKLIDDRAFAIEMGLRARQFAVEHCGIDLMAKQMEEVFALCAMEGKA